jgi:hypothetical protein
MDMEEAGAAIDLRMAEWKRDLDAMLRVADGLPGDAGAEAWSRVEELRRDLLGLRIKKAATWHAPEDRRPEARALFDETWNDWLECARTLKQTLGG